MYSVVLLMALTTGGDSAARGHHGDCCGCEGGRHHHSHGCCGQSSGCSSCGASYGCSSCGSGYSYAPSSGCPTCAGGYCPMPGAKVGAIDAPATIIVSLPADAKLTIDDEATTSTSDHRVFVSPNLPTGKEYHYTLKVEVMVNGKPIVVAQQVAVRAGEETKVTLGAPTGVAER